MLMSTRHQSVDDPLDSTDIASECCTAKAAAEVAIGLDGTYIDGSGLGKFRPEAFAKAKIDLATLSRPSGVPFSKSIGMNKSFGCKTVPAASKNEIMLPS